MGFDRTDRYTGVITELAARFIREEANPFPLITVTRVVRATHARDVTIFFTTIPTEGEENARIFLHRKSSEFRDYLKKHGRLHPIPSVTFEVDYGERHRQHIDTIVQETQKE